MVLCGGLNITFYGYLSALVIENFWEFNVHYKSSSNIYYWQVHIYVNCFVVQLLSCVWLSMIAWTAARQGPLSSTISQILLKFMSTDFSDAI